MKSAVKEVRKTSTNNIEAIKEIMLECKSTGRTVKINEKEQNKVIYIPRLFQLYS